MARRSCGYRCSGPRLLRRELVRRCARASTPLDLFSGGPEIPFRGGRVDASELNVPGVPEPHQDLPSHIAAFSRLGFTREEMIGLVACGWVA